jgi:Uncharacterised nucleotidyltransferase
MRTLPLDISSIPEELQIILNMLKEKQRTTNLENMDWNEFISLAEHHRLIPILTPIIKSYPEGVLPPEIVNLFNQEHKRNTFRMLFLCSEMERINQLLQKHQLKVLFLKGPILGKKLYGDISLRTSNDLDMLVPIQQLDQMERIILNAGYQKNEYMKTILGDWKWRHHHYTYYHPEKRIKIEVHWRLHPGPGLEPSFDELWERRATCYIASQPLFMLGMEDLFLFLAAHGARHGWSRLRWLLDIYYLLQQPLNEDDLMKLTKKYRYSNLVGQSMILINQCWELPKLYKLGSLMFKPNAIHLAQKAIFYLESMIHLHADTIPDSVSRYHKKYLFSLMPWKQKLLFVTSFLYPYPEDAETLPLPKRLHFLYFFLRPFLVLWRRRKRQAVSS